MATAYRRKNSSRRKKSNYRRRRHSNPALSLGGIKGKATETIRSAPRLAIISAGIFGGILGRDLEQKYLPGVGGEWLGYGLDVANFLAARKFLPAKYAGGVSTGIALGAVLRFTYDHIYPVFHLAAAKVGELVDEQRISAGAGRPFGELVTEQRLMQGGRFGDLVDESEWKAADTASSGYDGI